jgi:DNA polymerase III subunit delta'
LLDLAAFYRDVLMVQLGTGLELVNPDLVTSVQRLAQTSAPEATLRRIEAVLACREAVDLNVAPLLAVEAMALSLHKG